MVSQVSFGSVDEVLLPTSSVKITEYPFHLTLLGSTAATSVASDRKELGLKQAITTAISPAATSVAKVEKIKKEIGLKQDTTNILANMSKEGRDLIRNELWIEKVNMIHSQNLSI